MESGDISPDKLVKVYLRIKEARDELKAEFVKWLEAKAKDTDNQWDDALVPFVKRLLGVKDPE